MMRKLTTHDMAEAHEKLLALMLQGRKSRGSGSQWHDRMDGRNDRFTTPFALAWDGKSTLGKSVGVTRDMWRKAVEQSGGEIPLLALRFYASERLVVDEDLVVLSLNDFVSILEAAREHARLREEIHVAEPELPPGTDGIVRR